MQLYKFVWLFKNTYVKKIYNINTNIIMKIQINGFDIEVLTEESNLTIKVIDANGKELSNNTFTQQEATSTEINAVDMPSVEDTANADKTTEPDAVPDENSDNNPDAQSTEEPTSNENDEPKLENFYSSFADFKKNYLKS